MLQPITHMPKKSFKRKKLYKMMRHAEAKAGNIANSRGQYETASRSGCNDTIQRMVLCGWHVQA